MSNEKDDSNSLLKAAGIAAPTAVGTGFAVRNYLNEPAKNPGTNGIDRAIDAIYRAQKKAGQITFQDHRELMKSQQLQGTYSTKKARLAWQQAMMASDPFAKKHLPALARSIESLPEEQITEAIERVMNESSSKYSQEVFSRFSRNLKALAKTPGDIDFIDPTGAFSPEGIHQALPSNLQKYMNKFLGNNVAYSSQFFSRKERPGYGMYQVGYFLSGGQEVNFNLPISKNNTLMTGLSQQTRRIAPDIGILEKGKLTRLSREEYFMREFSETIGRDISTGKLRNQADINKSIKALWENVYGGLEVIPNIDNVASIQRMQNIRGKAIDLRVASNRRTISGGQYSFSSAYRELTEEEIAKTIRSQPGLFAGTSPTALSKGRLQTEDLSKLSPFPKAIEWSRRPEASIREYGLTKESARLQKARYRQYEGVLSRELEQDVLSPSMRALYVDPSAHKNLLEEMKMGDGEAIAKGSLGRNMYFETGKSAHLTSVHPNVQSGNFSDIKLGEVLGFNQAGEAVKYEKNMRLLSRINNTVKDNNAFTTLNYMDTRRMATNDKFFGDFKALVRLTEDQWFQRKARRLTNSNLIANNIDVIVTMDELKKDPGKFAKQVFSSLGEELYQTNQKVPFKAIQDALNETAFVGDKFKKKVFAESAMTTALDYGLDPKAFGRVFGAVPYIFGEEEAKSMFTTAINQIETPLSKPKPYLENMFKGVAGGIAKVSYGGPEELLGAGKMASLEPRAFDILQGKGFSAGLSQTLTQDLVSRMEFTDPGKFATHKELGKTLQSLTGEMQPSLTDSIYDLSKKEYSRKAFQEKISSGKPFWLKPGQGFPSVYVPGAEDVGAMKPFQTATSEVAGDLANTYHSLARQASAMYSDVSPLSRDQFKESLSQFQSDIQKQWAPGGKGAGAYLRGKLTGTRGLKGVSYLGGYSAEDLFTIGIPEKQARDMVQEMIQTGMYTADQMTQAEKWLAGEEKYLGGLIGRHPMIGEHSIQQARFRMIRGANEAQMVIPEIERTMKIGSQNVDLRLGPLLGMAGDKDADVFSAMLVSPDAEKQIRKNLNSANHQATSDYIQHQIRYQMLKAKKAPGAELSQVENMVAAARKLGTTQRYVPKISLQMTEAKRAVKTAGASADSLMLLEWLEQTPISAKHISGESAAAGELETLMAQLTGSLQARDAGALEDVITRITADNEVANSLLKGSVQISSTDAAELSKLMGGKNISTTMKGVNVPKATKEIMSSLNQFDSSGGRIAELLTGRAGRVRKTELSSMLEASAKNVNLKSSGVFSKVSSMAIAASNKMAALGAGISKYHKPIGLGFAGTLALGAILSTPRSSIGPGAGLIPNGKITGPRDSATKMQPERLMQQRQIGSPSTPGMHPPSAMITSPQQNNLNVDVNMGSHVDPGSLGGAVSSFTNGTKNVNVNIRDNRSSLDPHSLANRLF